MLAGLAQPGVQTEVAHAALNHAVNLLPAKGCKAVHGRVMVVGVVTQIQKAWHSWSMLADWVLHT